MRTGSVIALLLLVSGVAYAQPGVAPQAPPQPMQPYPYQPQYGYGQRPVLQYQLTLDEQYLLETGFISDGQWLGGAVANWFVGFGVGQAIQGRWSDRGWIFTVGEGVSIVALIYGATQFVTDCNSDGGCNDD